MPDIVLLDGNGNSKTYPDVETVTLPTEDGGTQAFETQKDREHPKVELDFSEGDAQEVAPGEGAVFDGVTIKKPDNLTPENIPAGVTIAGVEGALEAITMQAIAERTIAGAVTGDAITTVGSYAFQKCSLITEVNLPNCAYIGSYAFQECTGLSEVSAPVCSSTGSGAFIACNSLESVYFPQMTRTIMHIFSGCSALKNVTLGCDSNFRNTLYSYAFTGCSKLSEIKFMYSGSYVDGAFIQGDAGSGYANYTFTNCKLLKSVRIAMKSTFALEANATLGSYMFASCYQLSQVTIEGILGATRMSSGSSSYGLFEIGEYAFGYCSNLSTLTLPILGSSIGFWVSNYAFYGCSKLQSLYLSFLSAPPNSSSRYLFLGSYAFVGTPIASSGLTGTYGSIYVTKNVWSYLKLASGWKAYSARMVSY